jgi:hypothetical protein
MLTRMARTGCGSHGLCLLRLHQRKGSLVGAGLAGTMRAVRLPAEVGDCRARFSDRAGSLTGALLPRPPRWLCLQRHDMARDKVIFACGPAVRLHYRGCGHNHLLTGGSGPFLVAAPCRGHESAAARSTGGNATCAGEDQRRRGTEPPVPRCPAATNSASTRNASSAIRPPGRAGSTSLSVISAASDSRAPICTPASERRRAAAAPRSVNLSPRCQPVLSKTPRRQL